MKTVRQHVVNNEDLKEAAQHHRVTMENMVNFTRAQMVSSVRGLEEDLAQHKAYLDQLLAVVIEHNPDLLSLVGEAHRNR